MQRRTFIQTFALSSGCLLVNPKKIMALGDNKSIVKILMLYNNTGKSEASKPAWGLSVWIEHEAHAILFDVGGDPSVLEENISASGINMDKLNSVVISHKHWDHKNGLGLVLGKAGNMPDVYVVKDDLDAFRKDYSKAKLKSVDATQQIHPDIWVSGQLKAYDMYEQSLIITQDDALVLLTGCSHSGIVDMVKSVKQDFPGKSVELVAGGYHLGGHSKDEVLQISNSLKELEVSRIAPSHCTGDIAIDIFRKEWGENFVSFNLGDEFLVS